MIFVTLGTQDKPFTRLLKAIDKVIADGIIKDDVIVQSGFTKFKSNNMKIFDLIEQDVFISYMQNADLVITHGGVGSIITALNFGKKVIAAPRLHQFGEHVNDHQLQIIKCFEEKKYILPLYDFDKFADVLQQSKIFLPVKFESNREQFLDMMVKLIDE